MEKPAAQRRREADMKTALLILVCLVSMTAVGAYALRERGLLTADVIKLFVPKPPGEKEEEPAPAPVGLAASLQEKERQLEKQYREAEVLDTRLKQQRDELAKDKKRLDEQLRALEEAVGAQSGPAFGKERMTELVKIYEGMEPEGAASLLENLPDQTVAEILLQMRRRQAAQVMESLSIAKGVAVSARILPEKSGAAGLQQKEIN
ncbi:MAG: hypothetical protein C4520_20595 [Candidatus Abyssobacteria bacterium SURF_5]|uniref:Magnesium transporter MgtE intracellular domain-containing protein n=1 Tax=Abyssobacteria bacterium (strain SURF_5) TaxID=2093360 RepID=A0A3A4N8M4_ABYX5|nr:MAG: hypothetical protein C4520_20595 [Candidatus Abyssubacteria bacterium SURF_5]